jgi:hypothetical protein
MGFSQAAPLLDMVRLVSSPVRSSKPVTSNKYRSVTKVTYSVQSARLSILQYVVVYRLLNAQPLLLEPRLLVKGHIQEHLRANKTMPKPKGEFSFTIIYRGGRIKQSGDHIHTMEEGMSRPMSGTEL